MDSMNLILWPAALINVLGFILMGIDRFKSKYNLWRIKEKTFFIVAILGGSAGVLMGMYFFRHKTKHLSFTLGIPIILFLQLAIIYFTLT